MPLRRDTFPQTLSTNYELRATSAHPAYRRPPIIREQFTPTFISCPNLPQQSPRTVKLASEQSSYPDLPCTESVLTPPPDQELSAGKMEDNSQVLQLQVMETEPISRPSSTSTQNSAAQNLPHMLPSIAAAAAAAAAAASQQPQPRSVATHTKYILSTSTGRRVGLCFAYNYA